MVMTIFGLSRSALESSCPFSLGPQSGVPDPCGDFLSRALSSGAQRDISTPRSVPVSAPSESAKGASNNKAQRDHPEEDFI